MDSGGEWAETETAEGGREPGRAVLGRGDVVDKFIIVAELGAGGMGVVYEAYDPGLDRKVALKLLRTDAGGDGPRARLLREAQAMARVVHPNVVTVYEAGRWRDRIFLAMEKVSGGTLRAWEA